MRPRQDLESMLLKLDGALQKYTHTPPLVGIAHGDLNCANIICDAYDGIWIIDPAQLTLDDAAPFRDYAKLETCMTIEAVTLPLSDAVRASFADAMRKHFGETGDAGELEKMVAKW